MQEEGRRPLHIPVACEGNYFKHQSSFNPTCSKDYILAKSAYNNINSTDYQSKFKQFLARSGLLIRSPRLHPGPAGLAIVAAIQAELDESEETTPVESGVKRTAGGPVSPTSATPAATRTSLPIAWQINPVPTPLNSIDENKVQASRGRNCGKSRRLKNANDNLASRESIFSTAALSPPNNNPSSYSGPGLMLSPDFLKACLFCKRRLGPGKDTYMYRGDQAFCTTECRYKQIVIDERRERFSATACKGDQASTTNHHKHNNRILASAS